MKQEDEELYYDFWQIWMTWTAISNINKRNFFMNAIAALRQEKYSSGLLSHIMLSLR